MARVERSEWKTLVQAVRGRDRREHPRRPVFSDADIVLVLLWARLHGRPVCWACAKGAWAICDRKRILPSTTTMCRRLRTASVIAILDDLSSPDAATSPPLAYAVDGKPLVVSKHSKDPDARHGRGAGGMDKGFKLHLICGLDGRAWRWRVTPLNTPEQEIARRLVKAGSLGEGYLLGDTAYDWDRLHRQCHEGGLRLLVTRRLSRRGRGVRQRGVSRARLDCIASTETPGTTFVPTLLHQRRVIERVFARLETRWGIGRPPFYIRGLRRVRRWVQSALILDRLLYPLPVSKAA